MARKFFFTSYAVFFLPQFSTLSTLPPSRWTMPRMRSTILSTRSSARSGRTRKIVSYSRNLVPGACCGAPPVPCVSVCCITSPSWVSPRALPGARFSQHLRGHDEIVSPGLIFRSLRPPVVPVGRHYASFHQRRDRRLGGERNQLLQSLLLLRREFRQHPVRALPLLGWSAYPESHPHRPAAEMLPDAAQPVVPRVAAALPDLDASELQVD